jgi:large subunit ribosomal protein L4
MNGQQVTTLDLPPDIFEVEVNTGLMHQAYVCQMANARLGTHNVKTRRDQPDDGQVVSPERHRARRHVPAAPICLSVGTRRTPHPRSYTQAMPKKMRRQAIRCTLSALARDQQLVVVDELTIDTARTRDMRNVLKALVGDSSALVLLAETNENVQRSIANLPDARYLRASYLNIRDLLQYDKVIVPLDALEVIKSIWGQEG